MNRHQRRAAGQEKRQPRVLDDGEGGYLLDSAACLRIIFETPLKKVKAGKHRERIALFQKRVRAYVEAEWKAGRTIEIDAAVQHVGDLTAFDSDIKVGGFDLAFDRMWARIESAESGTVLQ